MKQRLLLADTNPGPAGRFRTVFSAAGGRETKTTALRPMPEPGAEKRLDKHAVAEIPAALLSKMAPEELIQVIRAAALPLLDRGACERLPYLDRTTLERLAHLARRCCRNQGY